MTFGIVILDMLELSRVAEFGMIPVQIPQPFVDCWIPTADVAEIGLEVLDIHGIETHNCRV